LQALVAPVFFLTIATMRLPVLSLSELTGYSQAAPSRLTTIWEGGAFAISNAEVSVKPPFASVRRLFDRADEAMSAGKRRGHRSLASVKSGAQPQQQPPQPPQPPTRFWRGLICSKGRERLSCAGLDRKRSIELTLDALHSRRLSRRLGRNLWTIQSFFSSQEDDRIGLVSILGRSLQHTFGMSSTVLMGQRLHRLLDYQEELVNLPGPRCHPHRDYGSFTLLWEDFEGLEVLRSTGDWAQAPGNAAAVVVAGAALSWLTAGRVFAPPHRVLAPPARQGCRTVPRRTSIAYFVEPAKIQLLSPVTVPGHHQDLCDLTYAELKRRAQDRCLPIMSYRAIT